MQTCVGVKLGSDFEGETGELRWNRLSKNDCGKQRFWCSIFGQGICYDGAKIRLSERLDHNEKRGLKTAEII